MLKRLGFEYDDEDKLWYARDYGFRVSVSEDGKTFHLYYGSFKNDLGCHKTEKSFKAACFNYNGTKL